VLGPELDLGPPEQLPPAAAVLEVWDGLRVVSCFGGADVISGSWADPVLEVDGAEHRRESLARAATYRRARPLPIYVNVYGTVYMYNVRKVAKSRRFPVRNRRFAKTISDARSIDTRKNA
jgi:hypothetical protein